MAERAASDDAADRERCRQLVDVERRFLERVDELRRAVLDEQPDDDAAASSTECSLTREQLTAYLRRTLPGSPELVVTAMEVVPGGRSKETILVSLAGTTELPAEIIVRKDRPVGILQTRAADEFAVLEAVYAHGGVPVPRPFFADEPRGGHPARDGAGQREQGGRVLPRPGRPDRAPARARGAAGRRARPPARGAARDPGDAGLDLDVEVTEATITAAVEGMSARIGELSGPPIAAVPLARQWLLDHVTDVVPSGPLHLLQGDVGLHNMLVDGDRVTALVDWEAATVGPPARELAAAWPAATALMEWGEFVDAYRAAGGPPEATNERAVAYYRVFFALGACMSSRTGGHFFRTGAKRDLLTAHSGLDAHFRAQRNLARALEDALDE